MRLDKVRIYGFGKWSDKEFDINHDYQVIFGPNESGKTTFLNFIKSVLFGFASSRGLSKYEQYLPKNSSEYGGELQFLDDDNNVWTVKRVAGKADGDLTIFKNDQEQPESMIDHITGGFDKSDFESSYVFDDNNIIKLYNLSEEQLEIEIMSIGTVGSKEWLETSKNLEDDAGEIYKPRGKKQILANLLVQREELQQQKSQFENQQSEYQRLNNDLVKQQANYNQQKKELENLEKNLNQEEQLVKKWSQFEEYSNLKIQNQDNIKIIPDDTWENFIQITQEQKSLDNLNQNESLKLSDVDNEKISYYKSQKENIDLLSENLDSIRQQEYNLQNISNQLEDNKRQKQSILDSNPKLIESMKPLSKSEMDDLLKTESQNNRWIILAVAAVALLLTIFTGSMLRIIFGLVFLVSAGYFGYDYYKKQQTSSSHVDQSYTGLSNQEIISIQGYLNQLSQLNAKNNELIAQYKGIETNLSEWRNLVGRTVPNCDSNQSIANQVGSYLDEIIPLIDRTELIKKNSESNRIELKQKLTDLNNKLTAILNDYDCKDSDEFTLKHQKQLELTKDIARYKSLSEFIGSDLEKLQKYSSIEELSQKYNSLKDDYEELSISVNMLNQEIGGLKNQIDNIFDDREYQLVENQLKQIEEDIISNYDEWLSMILASKWIYGTLNEASENRFPKMLGKSRQYFNILTNGNYTDIKLDNKNIKVTRKDKTIFNAHELSRATTIQLYLSLRLAFILEISDIVKLPILIDDAFVDFDLGRKEVISSLIKEISKDNQVIYVTANHPTDGEYDNIIKL
ncbi:ATP-binding protein [Lactobacillus terrae]|uniref:ATP-binding protein n=1 Tax=Lactobacillus terrae TaxID=2269374 RepID=UPI001473DD01|nr:AAA family ATPase [Lactobacillus terrae]